MYLDLDFKHNHKDGIILADHDVYKDLLEAIDRDTDFLRDVEAKDYSISLAFRTLSYTDLAIDRGKM